MATSDYKRRLINQLPAVLQTDVLKNFFATAIDPLFQPGSSEPISGYIGQKPAYYDPAKDFYIEEPTAARAAYQLEPAMVSLDNTSAVAHSLCYDDLINYLQSQGSIVSNHSRLFEGEYYSWAPPVDLDKLNNPFQYYWLGSLTDEEADRVTMNLRAERAVYTYDGNSSATYKLPDVFDITFPTTVESHVVLVNGEAVAANFDSAGYATIQTGDLQLGDVIETIRYGDLTKVINGRASLALYSLIAWVSTMPTMVNDIYTANVPRQYAVGELVYVGDRQGNGTAYRCVRAHAAGPTFNENFWTKANEAINATSGTHARLIDGIGTSKETARGVFFDGVGTSIELTPDYSNNPGGAVAHYVVIDRRSNEKSPWTRRNLWVHKSSFEWSGFDMTARKAARPIIEFLPNLELFNYGSRRLTDVQGLLTSEQATIADNFDIYPWDDNVWDEEKVNLSRINGKFLGRLSDPRYGIADEVADDAVVGSVVVDNGYVLQPQDRLFVMQTSSPEPELNNLIYEAVSNTDTPLPSGATVDVVELVMAGEPRIGDIVRLSPGKGVNLTPEQRALQESVFADQIEYWYNGIAWVRANTGETPPLFMLYDADQNALSDGNVYNNSDFAGSELFSYKVGTGTDDAYLGFPLVYNEYGQPIFEVDPIVNRVTYTGGEVSGYYYYRFVDTDSYSNSWFPVEKSSSQELVDGVYQIPLNLQANPGNFEVATISRNQWFDHFSEVMKEQVGFIGDPYTTNNWRDTAKELGHGNKILQHRAPLLKTMLLASDSKFDLPSSIRYAEQEYVRFRNRFVQTILELQTNGTLTENDPVSTWVDQVLAQLRLSKTTDFPFALNMMAGGQYFIPPTPTYLGVWSATKPRMELDTTLSTPKLKIRGHDGSLVDGLGDITTPNFGNFIDAIRLSFEKRIYDNLPAAFKTEAEPVFDLEHEVGGKYYEGDYSVDEINAILEPSFERWAQVNRVDYRLNVGFVNDAPFTWNYSTCLDRDGDHLPGNWRGIYVKYFDTFRPHIAPWEMVGFSEKPSYWDAEYGLAPYTRGNTKLWDDMRDGVIRSGVRAGTFERWARPTLYDVLPIDDQGRLMDPIAAGIVLTAPTYQQATQPWKMGDWSPEEYKWRTSVSYPFAMSLAGFLAKPARFVEQGWDTINIQQDGSGQWIYMPTGNRPLNSEVYVHGELNEEGTARVSATGVQQWLGDYMLFKGQDPSSFGNAVRGLAVRLAHKMAGFTATDTLRAMADNFGDIPAEDVVLELYHSPSIREEVYSGVLIEWTGTGYRVIGYDTRSPVFNIIEPMVGGPKGSISLSDTPDPVINSWQPNRYYPINTKVSYLGTVYVANSSHTSTTNFDTNLWTASGSVPVQAPRVTTYLLGTGFVRKVPYGTLFTTVQDVADFLLGYERYLESRGWIFDQTDSNNEVLNWSGSVKEFLGWSQLNWDIGAFVALSPSASGLKFYIEQGITMDTLTPINGVYGLLDRTGTPIDRRNIVVNRLDEETEILSQTGDIYSARVNVSEIEHLLIFSNKTIFSDIIYEPLYNLRQPRLRLIGRRTTNWTGRLDAPGYIITNDEVKPNFVKAADDLLTMFDIEQADNTTLRDHARHIIGYDNRDYLSSLVLSDVEQFEFFQGLIHQKGAPGAFNKLLRSDFVEQSRELKFLEEWAIKLDEYGAVDARNRIAFLLGSSQVKRNPQIIHFRTGEASDSALDYVELVDSVADGLDEKWIERPENPLLAFPKRDSYARVNGDLPVAGYVRLDEVQYTTFSYDDVPALYDVANNALMSTGENIWVHETPLVTEASNQANAKFYYVGDYHDGYWDGATQTRAEANTVVNNEGRSVFRSAPGEAPFISNDDTFTPIPGHTYTVTFPIRKIVAVSNGVSSFVRPAFDAFDADGVVTGALGHKEGFGYDSTKDMISTDNWEIGKWYNITATWTCPSSPAFVSARSRVRVNRTYPDDGPVPYSDAIYEMQPIKLSIQGNVGWDVYRVYELSSDGEPNTVSNVITFAEDPTLTTTAMRIKMARPHGLSLMDVGRYIVFGGSTMSEPELDGVQTISAVSEDWFEVLTTGKRGFDFVTNSMVGPEVRILKSVRFNSVSAFNAEMRSRIGSKDDDLAYVDGTPWRVMKRSTAQQETDDYDVDGITLTVDVPYWRIVRVQPKRVDVSRFTSSLIYDLKTKINNTTIQPEPLVLNHLNLSAPLAGKIIGRAESEIDFKLDYDPAVYTTGGEVNITAAVAVTALDKNPPPGGSWGKAQIGRVWWDLRAVRFLETETDDVIFGLTDQARYDAELSYRAGHWNHIAPDTSVDVYEWTRNLVSPVQYTELSLTDTTGTYEGTVLDADAPRWVEINEYDPVYGNVTAYYYWIKGKTITPNVSGRSMPVSTVARIITDPQLLDLPWIAPIMPNALLVADIGLYLDDTFDYAADGAALSGTVLQIEIDDHYEGVVHDEWMLLRPNDERSLPPEWLWDKLRDSLVGFDDRKRDTARAPIIPTAEEPTNEQPDNWGTDRTDDNAVVTPASLAWVTPEDLGLIECRLGINPVAITADGSTTPITYALTSDSTLPPGMVLSNTGVLTGEITPYVNQVWYFTMTATNGPETITRTFHIRSLIPKLPPEWVTPAGSIGIFTGAVSFQLVATDVDSPVLTYALAKGSVLPNGVTLDPATGLISGYTNPPIGSVTVTPFTVIVSDERFAVPRTFTLTIKAPNVPPVWVSPDEGALPQAEQGQPLSVQMLATDPEGGPITYVAATSSGTEVSDFAQIIPGVTFNQASGLMSGTPAMSGNYAFTIYAVDQEDGRTPRSFTLNAKTANTPPVWQTAASLGNIGVNAPYSLQLVAVDADSDPLTFAIVNGALPAGLTMSSTGLISGTTPNLTATTPYTFEVTVSDGRNPPVARTFTLTINYVFVADRTPDPLNWNDTYASGPTDDSFIPGVSVGGNTNSQTITGINVPITLKITCSRTLVNGENLAVYKNGTALTDAATQMVVGENSITLADIVNGDVIIFRFGGYYDTNVLFTVVNQTDGNAVLDTFRSYVDKTNEPDITPDPLDWTNSAAIGDTDESWIPGVSVGGNTNMQKITGINLPITLKITASRMLTQGENLAIYKNGATLPSSIIQGQNTIQFTVNDQDEILYRFGGFHTTSINFTVVNVTDSNTVLDTFTSTVTQTNDVTPDPVNWTNSAAVGPTDDSYIPGVSVGGNTNNQTITGIYPPITLRVKCNRILTQGENLAVYVAGVGLPSSMIQGQDTFEFQVSNNNTVLFRFGGFHTTSVVFTVTNVSDGNKVLDTFTSTITKTN
jgi:hypothetical protein